MSIGEVIRRLRLESGRSLESVAKELGISRQTMSRYETGVIGAIPYDNLVALARIYGVSPAYLMGWEEDTLIGRTSSRRKRCWSSCAPILN